MNKGKSLKNNLYVELFWEFFKLGLFTIGGGMVMLPLIQNIVVEKKGWLSEEEAVDCMAIGQSLPGVIAINMATYVGRKKKGLTGALCATTGVILPSFIIIILIVELMAALGSSTYLTGALKGIKAAATGLIGWSAYKVGRNVLKGVFSWMLALLSFGAVAFFGVSAVWTVLIGIVAGILYSSRTAEREDGGDGL